MDRSMPQIVAKTVPSPQSPPEPFVLANHEQPMPMYCPGLRRHLAGIDLQLMRVAEALQAAETLGHHVAIRGLERMTVNLTNRRNAIATELAVMESEHPATPASVAAPTIVTSSPVDPPTTEVR